jgi:hypothetical protein
LYEIGVVGWSGGHRMVRPEMSVGDYHIVATAGLTNSWKQQETGYERHKGDSSRPK